MSDVTPQLSKPARKATRAGKAAAKTAKATAKTVASEARTFSRNSSRTVKAGASKVSRNAKTVKSAGSEAADIAATLASRVAANRLRAALESLQQSSDDMSKWAGARASEYKDQASDIVQKRPLSSVGALFAVGALLGVVAGIALRN